MEFKDQVIWVRAQLNLSQEGLAKQLNVSFATINRWEQGHNKPTKKTLVSFKEFCRLNDILLQDIPLNYE